MKKTLLNCQLVCFFTTLDLIWPKFCHKDLTHFHFFSDFQWNMSGDSININNLCCNPAVLKKKKLLKIAFLGPISTKKGHYGPHPKWKIIFFCKSNNSRSLAPRNLFHQNIMFWLSSYESFSVLSDVFCQKKCHFQC